MGMAKLGNQLYTGERSFDFVGRRKRSYLVSGVVFLLSLVLLVVPGLTFGIEFEGGSEFRVSGGAAAGELVAADAVQEVVPGTAPQVTTVGQGDVRVQTVELDTAQLDEVRASLAQAYDVPVSDVTSTSIGPSWGANVTRQALTALVVFFAIVSLVMAVYFRALAMAGAAMLALVHDLVISAGIYALVGFEVTPATVIGFLTILGYSLYDTVVVFDKARENTDAAFRDRDRTFAEAANLAINQTVVRSVNTTVVAILPVAAILFIGDFLLGAGTLRDISLALFVGTIVGAASSVFIATPLLVDLRRRERGVRALDAEVAERRAAAPEPVGAGPASGAAGAGGTA
ncbi:protein translocase subunit SecF [Kineococcus sp. SYSU DK004]|uniref:protein translocase subunit SecF n=1 Tax=Kineococcus sp. SYSU DK004 TaxID=3383125 RepID=UPI003D7C7615